MQGKKTASEAFKCLNSVQSSGTRLVVWWRAKKAIYGDSNGLHGCVFRLEIVYTGPFL